MYKKMFTQEILLGDALFNLSAEAFKLYVLVTLKSDADGLCLTDRNFFLSTGTDESALDDLINAGLLYQFPDQVCVVLDFYKMNKLDHSSKFYKGTKYKEDYERLEINREGRYEINTVSQSPDGFVKSKCKGEEEKGDCNYTSYSPSINYSFSHNLPNRSPKVKEENEGANSISHTKDADADDLVFRELTEQGKIYGIISLYPKETSYAEAFYPIFLWVTGKMEDGNGRFRKISYEQIYDAVKRYIQQNNGHRCMDMVDLLEYQNLKPYIDGEIGYSAFDPQAELQQMIGSVLG